MIIAIATVIAIITTIGGYILGVAEGRRKAAKLWDEEW
jgi:hypothetical protein